MQNADNSVSRLLVGARAAAELLGISERTLWSISMPRGDLPVVRVGFGRKPRVLYSPTSLRAWIAAREQAAATLA